MPSHKFRPDLLSVREREVLDLAVEGKTDEQIAQALGLSPSTVNSYWVRIRGKVGQLSRTELVGMVLRHESGLRHADLIAEVERLKASELKATRALAQSEHDLAASRGISWHALALDHLSDATFVCRSPGDVVYANLQAQRLFAADPGELEGFPLWDLAVPDLRETGRGALISFFEPGGPIRVVAGIEEPYYALRRDGTNFRGVLIAEKFVALKGMMCVVTLREYMADLEEMLKGLRKPFVVL